MATIIEQSSVPNQSSLIMTSSDTQVTGRGDSDGSVGRVEGNSSFTSTHINRLHQAGASLLSKSSLSNKSNASTESPQALQDFVQNLITPF